MKNLKYLISICVLLGITVFLLSACSKDEENNISSDEGGNTSSSESNDESIIPLVNIVNDSRVSSDKRKGEEIGYTLTMAIQDGELKFEEIPLTYVDFINHEIYENMEYLQGENFNPLAFKNSKFYVKRKDTRIYVAIAKENGKDSISSVTGDSVDYDGKSAGIAYISENITE